jgi:hypothetical protein
MRRFLRGFCEFLKMTFNPPPHPEAERTSRQADKVEQKSEKLIAQADNFGTMVKGMRGELRRGSRRANRK